MKDDLSDYHKKILEWDVLLLDSPVYYNNINGEML